MTRKYLLDTDTWIEYFHDRHGIKERMASLDFSNVYVSEITIAELYFGALHSSNVKKHLEETYILQDTITILPISEVLMDYARLRQQLTSKGLTVDHFDLLIGATAFHFDLSIVTHNIKHFSKLDGIRVEDWWNVDNY